MKYECPCGYIYDEDKEGVKFKDLDPDFICPYCGLSKDEFELIDNQVAEKAKDK